MEHRTEGECFCNLEKKRLCCALTDYLFLVQHVKSTAVGIARLYFCSIVAGMASTCDTLFILSSQTEAVGWNSRLDCLMHQYSDFIGKSDCVLSELAELSFFYILLTGMDSDVSDSICERTLHFLAFCSTMVGAWERSKQPRNGHFMIILMMAELT